MQKPIVKYISATFYLFLMSFVCCMAQQTKTSAQKYFDNREYALAIHEFEKELKSRKITVFDKGVIEGHIGMSYYYLNKPDEAVNYIKKGIENGYKTAALYHIIGLALQKQEKYNDAIASFNECLTIDPSFEGAKRLISSCEYALANPASFKGVLLRSSAINTEGSEFGITPVSKGLFFFSRTNTTGKLDPRTGLSFTEIFSTVYENNDFKRPFKEKAFTKSYQNAAVFAFDSLNNCLYMTVCDQNSGRCGIYRSKLIQGRWEKIEPFMTRNDCDMAHPALANGGSRMYFTSNAPGGFGKTDVWYIDRLNNDQWSQPINAGDKVNSPGRDEFPYVYNDRMLFFASDGHQGFGGLDIFSVSIDDNGFGTVNNLGRPFNSGADDFNMTVYGGRGSMVSSRDTNMNDDIFIFYKNELEALLKTFEETEDKPTEPEPEPELKVEIAAVNVPVKEPEPAKPEPKQEPPKPEPKVEVVSEPIQPKPEPPTVAVVQPPVTTPSTATTPPAVATPTPAPVVGELPQEGIFTFYYDNGLFIPQKQFRDKYETVAAKIKNTPNTKFVVEGYSDDTGNNTELSEKRTKYIYDRLIANGVAATTLRIENFGNRKPANPNASTPEEKLINRRVIIRIDQK